MCERARMARVILLGATSAIAAECALLFAARGDRLFLVGRDPTKLDDTVARVRATSSDAVVGAEARDLAATGPNDDGGNAALIARAQVALGGIDVALIAHGDLGDQLASEERFDEAERILRVNFTSVVSLVVPLANVLEAQRAGALVVITSVAGDRGRPRNYTYGAAKGALGLYLQGVRSRLYLKGARVVNVKLGPVDTPMTTTHAKNALFAEKRAVARDIVRACDGHDGEIYVPAFWAGVMPVVRLLPESIFQRVRGLSGR